MLREGRRFVMIRPVDLLGAFDAKHKCLNVILETHGLAGRDGVSISDCW
jgi:hypothetical protein